jgi:predicted MFS family arabinose efflux permease
MPAIHKSNSNTLPENSALPHSLVLLLAAGAGFAVASLYYSQPIMGLLGAAMHTSDRIVGVIPTMTQLGYALGILLLSPLGDRYNRRNLILVKALALALALALCGMANNMSLMLATSLLIGISATLAQDIVPAAAHLAPPSSRGKVVGMVMTGLLLGILLSRVASGLIADRYGWRTVYFAAAAAVALFLVMAWRRLPHFQPTTQLAYKDLLRSMRHLWERHSSLRQATLAQGLLSIGFSAFWTTLAIMLQHTFHLGSSVAGAFGLAGAAGSIAAPLAGHLADRRGPDLVTRLGCGIAVLSFAAMGVFPLLSLKAQFILLALVAIGFDFGVQATLVAHQTIVFGIAHEARSRANALLFTGMFIGMAAGSTLGSIVLARWGWMGVTKLATLAATGAFLVRLLHGQPTEHASSSGTGPSRNAHKENLRIDCSIRIAAE